MIFFIKLILFLSIYYIFVVEKTQDLRYNINIYIYGGELLWLLI